MNILHDDQIKRVNILHEEVLPTPKQPSEELEVVSMLDVATEDDFSINGEMPKTQDNLEVSNHNGSVHDNLGWPIALHKWLRSCKTIPKYHLANISPTRN